MKLYKSWECKSFPQTIFAIYNALLTKYHWINYYLSFSYFQQKQVFKYINDTKGGDWMGVRPKYIDQPICIRKYPLYLLKTFSNIYVYTLFRTRYVNECRIKKKTTAQGSPTQQTNNICCLPMFLPLSQTENGIIVFGSIGRGCCCCCCCLFVCHCRPYGPVPIIIL